VIEFLREEKMNLTIVNQGFNGRAALTAMACAMAVFASSSLAFAHGEDAPGPHGGDVRMPGAFHTEVKLGEKSLQVYLLDMNFANPIVEKSDVSATLKQGSKTVSLKCAPVGEAFSCDLPKGQQLKSGELEVKANRAGLQGNVAAYSLPLKFGASPAGAVKSAPQSAPSGQNHKKGHGHHHGHHH
jgi:hypothetical protein